MACSDYSRYDDARVFPYRLLTIAEANQVYAAMGLNYTVTIYNEDLDVTRFLPAAGTGGANNYASIETRLVGEWLRHGHGGQWLEGMDLALYKSEWQVERSDNFNHWEDPGPNNNGIPHSDNYDGDNEHRYRSGMVWAYYLSGDERIKEALYDEAEILHTISLWAHERSMYQSLRAQAAVAAFTGSSSLRQVLKERLQYILWATINVNTAGSGWGWEAAPGQGSRRYFANSTQNSSEKPAGENFQARGFISASFGPIAFYEAAWYLGPGEPEYAPAMLRMEDLSWWTRQELYPYHPNPSSRMLVYSYAISLMQYTSMQQSIFHPILLGQGESYLATGDDGYLQEGLEQVENFRFTDQGPYQTNMYLIDSRLDCQHFFKIWWDWHQSQP